MDRPVMPDVRPWCSGDEPLQGLVEELGCYNPLLAEVTSVWSMVVALGRVARFARPDCDRPSSGTDGISFHGDIVRPWAEGLGPVWVTMLRGRVATRTSRMAVEMFELSRARASTDAGWCARACCVLRDRDDLASVAAVGLYTARGPEFVAAPVNVDRKLRSFAGSLPPVRDALLARARVEDPDAWWAARAIEPDTE